MRVPSTSDIQLSTVHPMSSSPQSTYAVRIRGCFVVVRSVGRTAWSELWPVVDELSKSGDSESLALLRAYEKQLPRSGSSATIRLAHSALMLAREFGRGGDRGAGGGGELDHV